MTSPLCGHLSGGDPPPAPKHINSVVPNLTRPLAFLRPAPHACAASAAVLQELRYQQAGSSAHIEGICPGCDTSHDRGKAVVHLLTFELLQDSRPDSTLRGGDCQASELTYSAHHRCAIAVQPSCWAFDSMRHPQPPMEVLMTGLVSCASTAARQVHAMLAHCKSHDFR